MPSFADLLQQGAGNAWLFIPSAVLLGALHGLEPGHSKTMMAAFIVAIRGTIAQAVLLGLAATVSHTAVVWGIALGRLYLWQGIDAEASEPYFQLASAAIIVVIALWMLWRTYEDQQLAKSAAGDHHAHGHEHTQDHHHGHHHAHGHYPDHHGHAHHEHYRHAHPHDGEVRRIDTGHGVVSLEVFEDGVPPRWRLRSERGARWAADEVTVTTGRPDGSRQSFGFLDRGDYLESIDEMPEPHEFMARLTLSNGGHGHGYDLSFVEGHGHAPMDEQKRGLALATDGYQDAHELAHANDIRRRFAGRNVTTGQIALFGLTGGLIPCPAAVTVLLLCLQLKELALGAVLVLCFSIGLAITLVAVCVAAAFSVHHAARRYTWFNTVARRAPYLSRLLIISVGLYIGVHGWTGLTAQAAVAR